MIFFKLDNISLRYIDDMYSLLRSSYTGKNITVTLVRNRQNTNKTKNGPREIAPDPLVHCYRCRCT